MRNVMPLEAQVEMVQASGLDTLVCCPDAWALRHEFTNTQTGETIPARCGSWTCPYCGPRKVDMWRQLIKLAEPGLHVVLTKVGKTLEEASRTLTTVLQYLRRGSAGRGKDHEGARPAYPIQVLSVLEEHQDFEKNGFHWHLLVKGVDFLPNEVVSEALRSATKGRSYITKVRRIHNQKAIGYVTKYLMKQIDRERRGILQETRHVKAAVWEPLAGNEDAQAEPYAYGVSLDDQGQVVEQERVEVIERMCKARRIRYSRKFFPASTAVLRRRLFGGADEQTEDETTPAEEAEAEAVGDDLSPESPEQEATSEQETPVEDQQQAVKRSEWVLREAAPFSKDRTVYRLRRRKAVRAALERFREGKRLYSRRVVSIWSYQREQVRLAG
jgi:hypothetical protein